MPPKSQRRLILSAGEECTISSDGLVQMTLLTGVVEVAGYVLELNTPYYFYLQTGSRALVIYTLEGGSVNLTGDGPVITHKGATGAGVLAQLTRRTLVAMPRAKVLVIGEPRAGKTLAAHTLVNLLRRHSAEAAGEGARPSRVCLLDLNAESNALFSPGCVTALPVPVGAGPLWLANTAAPTDLPIPFFAGTATRPSSQGINTFLHCCEQLHDTATAVMEAQQASGEYGEKEYMVIDAPSPAGDMKEGVFYRKLIEVVRPTYVVVLGDREKMDAGGDWCNFLQEDVQRFLPDCEFVVAAPCTRPRTIPIRETLMREYFTGSPFVALGCSKVVAARDSLQFTMLVEEGGGTVAAQAVAPVQGWKGLVCSLSHAETIDEVPLAPSAGMLLIVSVDEENGEVVMVIPASQDEPLQRRFVVIPGAGDGQVSLRVKETEGTAIEQTVVA